MSLPHKFIGNYVQLSKERLSRKCRQNKIFDILIDMLYISNNFNRAVKDVWYLGIHKAYRHVPYVPQSLQENLMLRCYNTRNDQHTRTCSKEQRTVVEEEKINCRSSAMTGKYSPHFFKRIYNQTWTQYWHVVSHPSPIVSGLRRAILSTRTRLNRCLVKRITNTKNQRLFGSLAN